jgi:periplasmic divalent cation tolerance protein
MEKTCIVFVTTDGPKTTKKVTDAALRTRLSACVNRVPGIISKYWWKGKIETKREELLVMKTRKSLVPALINAVKKVHPYSVPEVIAADISAGLKEYLGWINRETVKK